MDQGELIAEVGTGFFESHLCLPHDQDDTNINKWLPIWSDRIENCPDYLFDAVAQAERSVHYLLELHRKSCRASVQEMAA